MSIKSIIVFLPLTAVMLYSCTAGKKLKTAQAQLASLQTEKDQLTSQVNQLTTNVNDLKKQTTDLAAKNDNMTRQFNQYKKECQANEEELKEVNNALGELADNIGKLEEKLESAVTEFQNKGIDVYSKDGVVYIDMEDNLLYKSGSATLSADGKKVLGNLASVLNEYPKLKVIVVGNTDNVQFKKGSDNWTLSTDRANGVVRLLRDSYNVDPVRLTSAGKSKYNPIADNGTAEGRAKNRRTEIVLNPDWKRLWQSVVKNK